MNKPTHPTLRSMHPIESCAARPAAWRVAMASATLASALLANLLFVGLAAAATPAEQLRAYSAQAGQSAQAPRGEAFFTQKHGKEWSCSSCHTARPVVMGKHASTGKPIEPLAPAANAQRFTDPAKTEKWFRRNCNDVLGRECSAAEKADVLAWLMGLQP